MNNDIQKLNSDFEVKYKHESETKQPTFLGLTPAPLSPVMEIKREYKAWLQGGRKI